MKIAVSLIFLCFLVSCGPTPIEMPEVNLQVFKTDRGGCEAKRINIISDLEASKDSLLGYGENVIISTLGRYDLQMLDKRNQKVFIYFLEKGSHCDAQRTESNARSMAVYFNATKLVKEITFQKGVL